MMHQKIDSTSDVPEAQPRTLAQSVATLVAMARKRDVIDVSSEPEQPRLGPTPEQRAKAEYARRGGKVEKGQVGAAAYARLPLFEKLAKTHNISAEGLAALRFYRAAFEAQDSSPTRCALNDEGRGGGVPLCLPFSISSMLLSDLAGGTILNVVERQLGHALATMRAVALEDQTFSAVAIARFGSRIVPYVEQERRRPRNRKGEKLRYVDKVVPISGRHRQIIADEFTAGVDRLIHAHAPYASTARRPAPPAAYPASAVSSMSEAEQELVTMVAEEVPPVDPALLDDAGHFRPWAEVAAIIRSRGDVLTPEAEARC